MSATFDDLMEFPVNFTFRLITYAREPVVEECSQVLRSIFGSILNSQTLPSSSGRFFRLHITVFATSAAELYSAYDALKDIDGIKMVI